MPEPLSSAEARMVILEMVVAALIAQQPKESLEEVVGMLSYVAGLSEEAEAAADGAGQEQLANVHHWASQMLERVMASRKPSRPATLDPTVAAVRRAPPITS